MPRRTEAPPADPVTSYARSVLAGTEVAGPHVRNACRRHLHDIEHGPARGLVFDLASADRALRFFPTVLRLSQGQHEGKPFDLHPSQAFIVGSLFGWRRAAPATERNPRGLGPRRFRRAYIEKAKGSGKSPLAAGIGMYCLLADGEAQAEVYAGASMKSQAMVVFRAAVNMWRQSPGLGRKLTPSGGNPVWNLAHLESGSFFRPISTEEAHSGPMPSCALLDELHEHADGHMLEMMERGFKSRRQPLVLMITNSGSDRQSVCWEEHQHAVRCAAGTMTPDEDATFVGEVVDDTTFSYVCGLDRQDDPLTDEACWVKANPLLGISMPEDELRRAVRQARQLPGKLNSILRLHFCVWTDAEQSWMSRATLEPLLEHFDPEEEHAGQPLYVGVDLSATQDITALGFVVPAGPDRDGRPTYVAWAEGFTPAATLEERAARDQTPYDVWVRDGWLTATPGRLVRMGDVARRIAEVAQIFDVQSVAYDSYAFRKNLEPELDEAGVTLPLVEHPQGGKRRGKPTEQQKDDAERQGREATGLWMPGSKKELEDLMLSGRIRLLHSPLLIGAFMSAATEEDPWGNSWFSKRKATARIDALVAIAMAVGAATAGVRPVRSVYETRGLLTL